MNIDFYALTAEELDACINVVTEIRAKREKEEKIKLHRERLKETIISAIDAIGLEETKRIIREINRDLRG